MNAYVFLFAFISELTAIQSEEINVGTVLFSPSDMTKRWSSTEIALLRARRHFQAMIPPPNLINTNEDFINSILGYFKVSYSSVKSEAKDSDTDSIMNAALSDAIGGYLKAWVLPITKFAYYGGTVSQEDAIKLFQLYNEIKQSLDTDGKAWRNPNTNLLDSVTINVAPLRSLTIRGVDKPCDSLAYFEKTDTGLSIPVPSVNWNESSASMFVPLKNQSLIPLHSSNNESLIKYYNAATSCIESSKLEDQRQFENRFQNWLTEEVLPHLNDEQFYPALGSVLALVNKTRNLIDTVIDLYSEKSIYKKTTIAGIPVDLSSKKMMVISVIIILEVAWCIPTLCYLLCVRMKRKKNNVYLYVDKGKGKKGKKNPCISESTQYTPPKCASKEIIECKAVINKSRHEVKIKSSRQCEGVTLIQQPRAKSCNVGIRHSTISCKPSLDKATRSCNSSQMRSHDVARIINERPIHRRNNTPKKSSVGDVDTQQSSTSREVYSCVPDKNSLNISESLTTSQDLEPTKTDTILKERNRICKIAENEKDDKETQKTGEETVAITTDATKESFMCVPSIDHAKRIKSRDKSVKTASSLSKSENKIARGKNQKIVKDCKSRGGLKLSSGKPYLEITIDRPQRQVSVDFCQNQAEARARQSKIPKRAFNSSEAQTLTLASKNIQSPSFCKRKSCIPQPKRQKTVDDIIIKNKKTSTGNQVLNVTL